MMHNVGELLGFVGQYGLPLVLLFVLAYAYDRKETKHDEERKAWEKKYDEGVARWDEQQRLLRVAAQAEHQAIREACAEEREAWAREREAFIRDQHASFNRERETGEKIMSQLMESQRNMTQVISQANQMAGAFEAEKREIREARDREIRDTGPRQPFKLPSGSGGR